MKSFYRRGRASRATSRIIEAQGLGFPERPEAELPKLPADLTGIDEATLMDLWTQTVAWSQFAASQLAMAAVDEKDQERRAEAVNLREVMAGRARGLNVTDARNEAKASEEVLDAQTRMFEAEAYRKLLETVVASFDKSAALLSRELTRRTAGQEYRRRDSGVWST